MSPKETTKIVRAIELVKEGVKNEGVRGLARATGLSPAIITRYMQGKVGEPTTATLQRLSTYFRVPVSWLRGDLSGSIDLMKELVHFSEDEIESIFEKAHSVENLEYQRNCLKYEKLINCYSGIPDGEKDKAFRVLQQWKLANYDLSKSRSLKPK